MALVSFVSTSSAGEPATAQGNAAIPTDGIQVNTDDSFVDAAGSDAVVPVWDAPPKVLIDHLLVYLLFIGGPMGLLIAFPVLCRLEKKALLSNNNRNSVFEYIRANPGCTREDIHKGLAMNIGTVYYHVATLKFWGLIGYGGKGKFKRVYAGDLMGNDKWIDRTVCAHMRNYTARTLLEAMLHNPGINPRALVRIADRDDSTIHWHLKRFLLDGLITIKNDGIYRRCFVKPDITPALEKHLSRA